jgi:dATP pyrophosphohydrolase
MSYKRPESVLVILFDEAHQVLVMQRADDPDFWQSVTGTIEAGEAPLETAYREVLEETGLDLRQLGCDVQGVLQQNQYQIRPQWRYRYPPGTVHNTEFVFSCQVPSGQPILLTEHLAHRWVCKEEALQIVWSESNRNAIADYVELPQ